MLTKFNLPFTPNYPVHPGYSILTTPERIGLDVTDPTVPIGRGVVMAFIDSGFYPHPDIADRVICHVDATSSRVIEADRHYRTPQWYSWHGQMTTVIGAGAGRAFPGVARGAGLVLIKVSTHKRQIKEPDILRGFRWLLANHRAFNIRVVNVSVGGDYYSLDPAHPLHLAVAQLTAEGVTVCVAAGNQARGILVPPASAPAAITVGGVDDHNSRQIADWNPYNSNWGTSYDGTPKPEVIAPARWIASPILPRTDEYRKARWLHPMIGADESTVRALLRDGYADLGFTYNQARNPNQAEFTALQWLIDRHKIIDTEHQHVDGTSVSVAFVSGVVAALLEVNPALGPLEIRAILTGTAAILPGIPRDRQGGGLIDASRALAFIRAGQPAPIPASAAK